jgi:pantetheine-phosphate adenylyltransferase
MRIALYPGSFDPVTNGHLDVVRRAEKLYDKVIVAVAHTPRKTGLFTPDERKGLLAASLPDACYSNLELSKDKLVFPGFVFQTWIDSFNGLLTDYARRIGATVIIRGLRAVADFEFEFQFTLANKSIDPELEFVHLMTDEGNLYTSSSLVREIAYFGGDVSRFVPPPVRAALECKYGKQPGKGS